MKTMLAIAAAIGLSAAAPAVAAPNAVPDYGQFAPVPGGKEQPVPGRDYKVVFEVSEGTPADGKPLEGLQRVARYVNLLAAGGVAADHRHVIAVLDGPATEAIMTDKAFAARHGGSANPSTKLIQELQAAGVSVRVCGQAMAGHKITPDEVLPGVEIDLAALMTVTNRQLEGYAIVEE
jgi:intracellular sulfur oxidation DsrE/DsrF family protein